MRRLMLLVLCLSLPHPSLAFAEDRDDMRLPVTPLTTLLAPVLLGFFTEHDITAVETWQGKRFATRTIFTNWCPTATPWLFDQLLPALWGRGHVPVITWEPFLCQASQTPRTITQDIAAGRYDTYLRAWGTALRTFLAGPDGDYLSADDRRVYLRLAHEMNGTWYPWSAGTAAGAQAYVRMWRHVHDLLTGLGLDVAHVQWLWTVNHRDVGDVAAEACYPGDAYVDWIGIDGYNWGSSQPWSSWESPEQLYEPMRARLRRLTVKPLALTEVGSSSQTAHGPDTIAKAATITAIYRYALMRGVRMITWFNLDKETDWAVFGSQRGTVPVPGTTLVAYDSYRQAIQDPAFYPSRLAHPQLLPDEWFLAR